MLEFTLSLADALRFRFTISPVGEVVRLARALANPATFTQGVHTAWLDGRGSDLRRLQREHDLRPLFAVLSARSDYYPDFFTPTPTEPLGDIEAELAQIRATPASQTQEEIDLCLQRQSQIDPALEAQLRSPDAAKRLARLLEALWEALIAPSWPRLRDLLERDVLHRSRLLARGGLASLFTDLAPLVTLEDRRLLVDLSWNAKIVLDGCGLQLMPSAFISPYAVAMLDERPPTVVYPSRGVASLFWDAHVRDRSPAGALARQHRRPSASASRLRVGGAGSPWPQRNVLAHPTRRRATRQRGTAASADLDRRKEPRRSNSAPTSRMRALEPTV